MPGRLSTSVQHGTSIYFHINAVQNGKNHNIDIQYNNKIISDTLQAIFKADNL